MGPVHHGTRSLSKWLIQLQWHCHCQCVEYGVVATSSSHEAMAPMTNLGIPCT